jgi:hypothetical protein
MAGVVEHIEESYKSYRYPPCCYCSTSLPSASCAPATNSDRSQTQPPIHTPASSCRSQYSRPALSIATVPRLRLHQVHSPIKPAHPRWLPSSDRHSPPGSKPQARSLTQHQTGTPKMVAEFRQAIATRFKTTGEVAHITSNRHTPKIPRWLPSSDRHSPPGSKPQAQARSFKTIPRIRLHKVHSPITPDTSALKSKGVHVHVLVASAKQRHLRRIRYRLALLPGPL